MESGKTTHDDVYYKAIKEGMKKKTNIAITAVAYVEDTATLGDLDEDEL